MATPMGKRTKLINDPSDLVLLLRTFGSNTHKEVFDELSDGWVTEQELSERIGADVKQSLEILRKSGLIESQWRMPEPGKTPDKEYTTTYSKLHANFQCSVKDISDLIMITFKSDAEISEMVDAIEEEVTKGNRSMVGLSRALDMSSALIRGVARRSCRLAVKGQRLELIK
jgi:predicted DNA-binding ArsR family transcriptional regulator